MAENPGVTRAAAHRQSRHLRQSQAQQSRQGLARRPQRLDRLRRQQRADAARLRAAAAARLAARHRHPVLAAHRLPPAGLLGRARVRLPQHLPGALAICGRQPRPGLRAGQDDARAPGATSCAPAASRRWPRRSPRTRPPPSSCAASGCARALVDAPFGQPLGPAHAEAGLGPPDALGAPAPHQLPRSFRGRDPDGLPAAARSRGLCRRR